MKKPRLSDTDVRTIRHLGRNTETTYRTLAARYGVSESCIGQVVRGSLYASVPDDPQDDEESLDEFLDRLEDEPEPPIQVGDVVKMKTQDGPRLVVELVERINGRDIATVTWWSQNGPMSARVSPALVQRIG